MNIFEKSIRGKYRYPFRGQIQTEDLFSLNLKDLDEVYKNLTSLQNIQKGSSLLDDRSAQDLVLEAKIEVVKAIFVEKSEEKKRLERENEDRKQKQRILEIIEMKKEEELFGKSVDELMEVYKKL